MEIRLGNLTEKEELKNLWKEVFNEDDFYLNYKFDDNFDCSNSVVVTKDNKIIGSAHFDICFMDNKKCAYINGVSINQKYRGMGISLKMMDFLHNYLKDKGFAFCFLKPAINNFYEKFGYRTYFKGKKELLNPSPAPSYEVSDTGYFEVFNEVAAKSNIYLPRTQKRFNKLISLYENYGGGIVCFKKDNKPFGYCLWAKEDNRIVVEESVFTENEKSVLKDYFKTDVEINELPVMVKDLNEKFNYKTSFIKVI